MFYNYVQNTSFGISDLILLQHENLEDEKDSVMCIEAAADRNKKYAYYEYNNPNYDDNDNDYGVSSKNHSGLSEELKQARFLIAESEKELQSLFKTYLDLIGAEGEIVDDGNRALAAFLQNTNEGKVYDAVVVDTHLKGKKGLEVAKKIHERDNSQKIVLVTTSMKEQLPKDELQSASIDEKDILVMPFSLSRLSKMIIR